MASFSLTTSPYLAYMSKRLASCGALCRSPTASRTMIGMKPCEQQLTQVARAEPLVLGPVWINVSTPHAVSVEASEEGDRRAGRNTDELAIQVDG
jgi:hypothetical protein